MKSNLRIIIETGVCPVCHRREVISMLDTDLKTKFPCTLGRAQYKKCGKHIGMCRSGCPHSKTVWIQCEHPFHAALDELKEATT
jgi:hypothetical protein